MGASSPAVSTFSCDVFQHLSGCAQTVRSSRREETSVFPTWPQSTDYSATLRSKHLGCSYGSSVCPHGAWQTRLSLCTSQKLATDRLPLLCNFLPFMPTRPAHDHAWQESIGRDNNWKPHHLRVVRLDSLPTRSPALDGFHGRGVERLLAQWPLLVGRALGALSLPLPLLLVDVVHTQEQAVVHDLEALQHLPGVGEGSGGHMPPVPLPPTPVGTPSCTPCVCVHSVPSHVGRSCPHPHFIEQEAERGVEGQAMQRVDGGRAGTGQSQSSQLCAPTALTPDEEPGCCTRDTCSRPHGAAQARGHLGSGDGLLEAPGLETLGQFSGNFVSNFQRGLGAGGSEVRGWVCRAEDHTGPSPALMGWAPHHACFRISREVSGLPFQAGRGELKL